MTEPRLSGRHFAQRYALFAALQGFPRFGSQILVEAVEGDRAAWLREESEAVPVPEAPTMERD